MGYFGPPEFGINWVKGDGAIDFYLGSHKWGFELTRDGDQLNGHYSHFQKGGNYHRWIIDGELLDWLVSDFRSAIPSTKHSSKYTSCR